jgi:methionine synthase I (cobalamin-dependent)
MNDAITIEEARAIVGRWKRINAAGVAWARAHRQHWRRETYVEPTVGPTTSRASLLEAERALLEAIEVRP